MALQVDEAGLRAKILEYSVGLRLEQVEEILASVSASWDTAGGAPSTTAERTDSLMTIAKKLDYRIINHKIHPKDPLADNSSSTPQGPDCTNAKIAGAIAAGIRPLIDRLARCEEEAVRHEQAAAAHRQEASAAVLEVNRRVSELQVALALLQAKQLDPDVLGRMLAQLVTEMINQRIPAAPSPASPPA